MDRNLTGNTPARSVPLGHHPSRAADQHNGHAGSLSQVITGNAFPARRTRTVPALQPSGSPRHVRARDAGVVIILSVEPAARWLAPSSRAWHAPRIRHGVGRTRHHSDTAAGTHR